MAAYKGKRTLFILLLTCSGDIFLKMFQISRVQVIDGLCFSFVLCTKIISLLILINSKTKNKMKKLTIIIAALGLLAACNKQSDDLALPQSGQNNSAQVLRHARTFNATLNAAADANSAPTPCSTALPGGFAAPDFFLSGSADHMGLLNGQTSKLHHVSCDLDVTTGLLTTNVTVDLLSHTGEVIHCTGDDVVNVSALFTGGTTGPITGTWTITGGTGKFAGAIGSIDISGTVNFQTNSFSCACVGTINY
jgi:hypothetical protein